MGPIEFVGSNTHGRFNPTQRPHNPNAASFGETPMSISGVTTSSGSRALLSIQSSVARLLQSIGGGLAHDENLKSLIALLLLSALLRSSNTEEHVDQKMLQELGAGQGPVGTQGQYISFYASSTTFVMESSSPAVVTNQQSSAMNASGVESGAAIASIDATA